ncbi:MAG: hypothetical protein ABSE73_26595, partial [Planctomycetota bacterium]
KRWSAGWKPAIQQTGSLRYNQVAQSAAYTLRRPARGDAFALSLLFLFFRISDFEFRICFFSPPSPA